MGEDIHRARVAKRDPMWEYSDGGTDIDVRVETGDQMIAWGCGEKEDESLKDLNQTDDCIL